MDASGCGMAGRSDTRRQRAGSVPGLPIQPTLQLPSRAGNPTVLELRSVYQRAGTVPAAVAQFFAQLQPADAADLRPAELLVSLARHPRRRIQLCIACVTAPP